MNTNLANVLMTLFICAMLFGMIVSFSSCNIRQTEAMQKTKQLENDLEKCIGSCPTIWNVDKDCVNRCLDLEEKRLED